MPVMNLNNRQLKAKMVLAGVGQQDIQKLLRDKDGRPRSRTYVQRRMSGIEEFTAGEIRAIKDLLGINDQEEFLRIFFPGTKWEGEGRSA